MSTTIESSDSEQYLDYDDYVDFQLDKTRAHIRTTDILTAIVGVGTLTLGYLLAFVIFDQWVVPGGFGYATRVSMWSVVAVITTGWLIWKVAIPQMKQVNRLFAARAIERSEPGLKSTLLNLIDLERSGHSAAEPIRNTMERRAAVTLSGINVEQAVDRRFLTRLSYALLAVVVAGCLYWVLTPKQVSSSLWRAVFPMADVTVSTRTRIVDVTPGTTEVVAGSQLEVVAELEGELPESVTLYYTTADSSYVDEPVAMRKVEAGTKQFRGVILGENGRGILQDFYYYVVAGDGDSRAFRTWRREDETFFYLTGGREYSREDDKVDGELTLDQPDKSQYRGEFSVGVLQPPRATVTQIGYEFPKYMQLPPRTQPVGHVDAWEGAKVTWTAATNLPIASAVIQFSDDESFATKAEELSLRKVDDLVWTAQSTLQFRTDGTAAKFYRINVRNKKGETDPEPTVYGFKIRPDLPPVVELVSPRTDLVRPANAVVPLLVRARDPDFLLRFVHLRAEKDGQPLDLPDNVLFDGEQQSYQGTFEFDLAPLKLQPDDVITYWIEARDNNPRGRLGHNQPGLKIRIAEPAPPEEVRKQLDRDKQRNEDELEREQQENNNESDPEQEQKPGDEPNDDPSQEGKKQPQRKPGEGDEPSKSKPQPGEKGDKPQNGSENQPSDDGGAGKKPKPDGLKNDGSDDDRALKKAFEKFKRDQQKQKKDPNKPQDDEGQAKSKQKPGDNGQPKDGTKSDTPKPGEKKTKPKSDGTGKPDGDTKSKPESDEGATKPDEGQGGKSKKPPTGGKPTDKKKPGEKPQPGDTGEATKPGTKPGPESKDPKDPPNGKEQPDDPSKKGIKKKANGDETGSATLSKDPTDDPTRAKNKLDRNPGEKSDPRTSPRKTDDKTPSDTRKVKGKPDPKDPTRTKKAGTRKKDIPDGADPKDDPKKPPRDRQPDDPKGKPAKKSPSDAGSKPKPGDPNGAKGKKTKPGSGKPGDANSKQPGDGSTGSKPGTGKKKPGGKPGKGNAGGKKGPKSEQVRPKGGGTPSKKKPGAKSGDGGGGTSSAGNNGSGGNGAATQAAEKANLDYGKEAADLVLRRLEKDLKRGEVDEKLLKELGWTQEDARRFAERLRNRLEPASPDATPQDQARHRQFEETLKSLDLKSVGSKRTGKGVRRSGDPAGNFGAKRLPVPPEYREAYEAYTRSLAKRRKAAAKPKK